MAARREKTPDLILRETGTLALTAAAVSLKGQPPPPNDCKLQIRTLGCIDIQGIPNWEDV